MTDRLRWLVSLPNRDGRVDADSLTGMAIQAWTSWRLWLFLALIIAIFLGVPVLFEWLSWPVTYGTGFLTGWIAALILVRDSKEFFSLERP